MSKGPSPELIGKNGPSMRLDMLIILFSTSGSILDDGGDGSGGIQSNANTIKMENSAPYYCNSYSLSTAPPSLVSDRSQGSSMVVSSGYSKMKIIFIYSLLFFTFMLEICS